MMASLSLIAKRGSKVHYLRIKGNRVHYLRIKVWETLPDLSHTLLLSYCVTLGVLFDSSESQFCHL